MQDTVFSICNRYQNDASRLLDILQDLQMEYRFIPAPTLPIIAERLGISTADVHQTVSFYHLFRTEPGGRYTIYMNNSAVAKMFGGAEVEAAMEQAADCKFGQVSPDGMLALAHTSCIGMSDQEPAALIGGFIFPRLTPEKAGELIRYLRSTGRVGRFPHYQEGDGMNRNPLINSMVMNQIQKRGPLLDGAHTTGDSIKRLASCTPDQIIEMIDQSRLRGRGGAGFATARKWDACRKNESRQRYVFCNADEGEPGTFKDRVLLTEFPDLVLEGMVIAGYAIDADQGILYLRREYRYLLPYLKSRLDFFHNEGFLGNNVAGISGFNFDIRIQLGAGAYVCGEESALIESAEGKRGEPRDRPPFPVQKGYLQKPTVVNNVETLSDITLIIEKGPQWYISMGTPESSGTKLLSISGDCARPGVYEVEWGVSVEEILKMVGAENTQAVQVGGPSGVCIAPHQFHRRLCYTDLATGGAIIVIDQSRNLLKDIVLNYIDFFIEESCGSCTPCRALPQLLKNKLEKLLSGHGVESDLNDMSEWTSIMSWNRCGLGQTTANPIITTLQNFPHLYQNLISSSRQFDTGFDLGKATEGAAKLANREPVWE